MKKTVPLKKELTFQTNIAEITSIALDHDLDLEETTIRGNLVVSGSYKMNDVSINTEEFTYNIPVNIEMSDHYDLKELTIDVEDFYYEIVDNKTLNVSIEIGLDHLKEKEVEPILSREESDKEEVRDVVVEEVKEEKKVEKKEIKVDTDTVKSLFDDFDESMETYSTYKVCIVKESDTIESISMKYGVDKETLEQYNDLSDIKIGDKIIIPAIFNEKD